MAPLAVLLGALLILHVASEAVQPNAAAVRAAAGSGALVAVDSPTDAASAASPASSLKVSEGLDFTPTHEWQEVPKGAHIPAVSLALALRRSRCQRGRGSCRGLVV